MNSVEVSRDARAKAGAPQDGPTDELAPVGPARRLLAVLAALMALPYLGLKVAWLSGSRVGLNDPEFGTSGAMYALNALTGMLDVVAFVLAAVFFFRRGLRAPAWLVVPPMWIGAGLLGQVLLMLPYALIAQAVNSPAAAGDVPLPIAGWVFTLVYAGFAGMGIGLLGAFAIYARQRWGRVQVPAIDAVGRKALLVAAVLVLGASLVHLAISDHPLGNRLVDLLIAGVAAAALVTLARRRSSAGVFRAAVVLGFVGTGALAAWGTYHGVVSLVPNELVGAAGIDWPTAGAAVLRMIAGFAGAGAMVVRLRRR